MAGVESMLACSRSNASFLLRAARALAPLSSTYCGGSWKSSSLLAWIYTPVLAITKKQCRCLFGYSQSWMSGYLGSVLRSVTYLLSTNLVNPLSCSSRLVSGELLPQFPLVCLTLLLGRKHRCLFIATEDNSGGSLSCCKVSSSYWIF